MGLRRFSSLFESSPARIVGNTNFGVANSEALPPHWADGRGSTPAQDRRSFCDARPHEVLGLGGMRMRLRSRAPFGSLPRSCIPTQQERPQGGRSGLPRSISLREFSARTTSARLRPRAKIDAEGKPRFRGFEVFRQRGGGRRSRRSRYPDFEQFFIRARRRQAIG